MTSEVRIELTGAGCGTVTIDGVAVPGVAKVEFYAEVDAANRLVLHLIAPTVTITGPADVQTVAPYVVGKEGPEVFLHKIVDRLRRGRMP